MSRRQKLVCLSIIWLSLVLTIVREFSREGIYLLYPVMVAWLGGIVSLILIQEIADHIQNRRHEKENDGSTE